MVYATRSVCYATNLLGPLRTVRWFFGREVFLFSFAELSRPTSVLQMTYTILTAIRVSRFDFTGDQAQVSSVRRLSVSMAEWLQVVALVGIGFAYGAVVSYQDPLQRLPLASSLYGAELLVRLAELTINVINHHLGRELRCFPG